VTSLLTEEMRLVIGRETTYVAPEPLGLPAIRYFDMAMDLKAQRGDGEAAPTLVCETNQLVGRRDSDENGYFGHSWTLPLPVRCSMVRGGNEYRFGRPVRADDIITTTWRLTDAVERRAADGAPMLIVTAEADYYAADGEWLATNIETLVFTPVSSR
jgi:hypothetical protein